MNAESIVGKCTEQESKELLAELLRQMRDTDVREVLLQTLSDVDLEELGARINAKIDAA